MSYKFIKQTSKIQQSQHGSKIEKRVVGFWKRECICVFDSQISNTECKSYRDQDPQKYSTEWNKWKRTNTLKNVLTDAKSFLLQFILLVNSLEKEMRNAERRLDFILANKLHGDFCSDFHKLSDSQSKNSHTPKQHR